MKKILCPTDFSDAAHNAIGYAAKFAQATSSELVLLHVESIFDLTALEMVRGKEMKVQALHDQLERQCKEISTAFKISCYPQVQLSGQLLDSVITKKADEFDLIAMGTNGVNDYYDFFSGTTTYRVIKESAIPVLLIPVGCEYNSISKITFAADMMTKEYIPIRKIVDWATLLHSKVNILQVILGHYSHDVEVALKRTQKEIADFYSEEMVIEFDTLWSDEIASSIHSYMLRNQSDALALSIGHRNFIKGLFHKSVVKVISAIASYPVFALPA